MRRIVVLALAAGTACAGQPASEAAPASSSEPTTTVAVASTTVVATTSTLPPTTSTSTSTTSTTISTSTSTTTSTTSTTSTTTTTVAPTTTSCDQVVHIGDSLGFYLWEPQYVGGEENTMSARYADVGVTTVYPDNAPGRSIRETTGSAPVNAFDVALGVRETGYRGCWVLMIGTNDAANVAAGSNLSLDERILRMLYVLGDDPVLWVDAATVTTEGPWASSNMQAWNEALYRLTADRPNVGVVSWSAVARPEWFVDDGIHHTADGRAWFAAVTANGLVEHFPD